MTNISGGCRCGQLHFTLLKPPVYGAYCHCTECRRRNSSPCTGFVMVPLNELNCEGSSHVYREPGGSGMDLEHHRCVDCGTVVYSRIHRLQGIVAIPAANLNDPGYFKPQAHVWVSSKEAWLQIQDDLPQLPGPPRLPREWLG